MLDMGFLPDIRRVIAMLPQRAAELAVLGDVPRRHSRAREQAAPARPSASRSASATPPRRRSSKPRTSSTKARSATCCRGSSAPATGSKCSCSRARSTARTSLAEQLVRDGFSAAAIHGNKSQGARTRALADFKRNAVRVLVATDIAARGLDIDQLPHVVNYDLPEVAEHYVHRIGRTGRAGNEGLAVSLVGRDERPLLKADRAVARLRRRDPAARRLRAARSAPGRESIAARAQQPANGGHAHAHRGQHPRRDGGRRHGGRNHGHGSRSAGRAQGRGR